MKGRIIQDWSKLNLEVSDFGKPADPESWKKAIGAVQYFMQDPSPIRVMAKLPREERAKFSSKIQSFATKGDFPDEILQIISKFHEVPSYDLGYEQIYNIIDYTGTKESGFKISTVSGGLTFSEVKIGEKAKVYKFSGAVAEVKFNRYGGGLGWDRTLIDDAQYWQLEDNTIEFRNKAYYSRALNFYALIEAVAATYNVAWQAVTPTSLATSNENYDAVRDVNTINYACNQILDALKDSGMGVTPQTNFIILAPAVHRSRILRALSLIQQPVVGSAQRLNFNVSPIFTLMLASTSNYYVILPKNKLVGGYRMDLTVMSDFDILSYEDLMVGWMRYNGAVGELKQIARCAMA